MANNILQQKSFAFALRIVKLSQHLSRQKNEYSLSKKILDSGTLIGLYVEEARQAYEHSEFILKFSIANKEAFKTNFWLRLLRDSELISAPQATSLISDCEELQKMLISSIKTARGNQ